jgi:murein DD-endopeptidase MepM/ murein hydrolase activator NlpD
LSDADAAYFKQQSSEIKSDFAVIDQYDYSPLDPTNGNTFMGKFISSIAPATAKMSTISGGLTSISSLLSKSFASIVPTTSALSYGDAGVCLDQDYIDVATDINCNPLVGLGAATQKISIDEQLDYMINNGHIDEVTGTAKSQSLKDYIKFCPERTMAMGAIEEGGSADAEYVKLMRGEYCQDGKGEEMYDMFRAYRVTFLVAEGMDAEEVIDTLSNEDIVSPVSDGFSITSDFGPRTCKGCSAWHQGIDLINNSDNSIKAAMAGEVMSIDDPGGNNAVNILHPNGLITTYMHMESKDILVKVGDIVGSGQKLGVMGNSGDSEGIHLHFEINISRVENQLSYTSKYIVNDGGFAPGTRIDPKDFMAKNGIAGY